MDPNVWFYLCDHGVCYSSLGLKDYGMFEQGTIDAIQWCLSLLLIKRTLM